MLSTCYNKDIRKQMASLIEYNMNKVEYKDRRLYFMDITYMRSVMRSIHLLIYYQQ